MDSRDRTCKNVAKMVPLFHTKLSSSIIFNAAFCLCIINLLNYLSAAVDAQEIINDELSLTPVKGQGPNNDSSFDDLFEYEKIDSLQEFEDFDPERLMKLLIQSATSNSTPSLEFHKEIKELIISHQVHVGTFGRVDTLKKKYNIVSGTQLIDPETITYQRLRLMFPHYHNFKKYDTTHNYNQDLLRNYYRFNFCSILHQLVPTIMQHPEFGGLIPRQGEELPEFVRESIIRVHLYFQTCNSDINFHEQMILLEKRMEKSILSNEHRIRLLQKSNILLKDKQINRAFLNILNIIST